MTRRLPSLSALRAFEAAARHLSLTKAATELHVTPAAVSHQIKALEEDIGTPLLRRRNGKFVLSEAGRAGLPNLRIAFDRLTEAVRRMTDDRAGQILTVRVGPSFAASWLVPKLHRFKQAHPDINVRLDAVLGRGIQMIGTDFAREDIDVLIGYDSGVYTDCSALPLFLEEVFPVCSPDLCIGEAPLIAPADLIHHTLLHEYWDAGVVGFPDWQDWLQEANVPGIDVAQGPRFSNQAMAVQAATQGHGVALGSAVLVADDLASGRLVQPFKVTLTTQLNYTLFCSKEAENHQKIGAFRSWLLDEFAKVRSTET